jgi:hypothetical protein
MVTAHKLGDASALAMTVDVIQLIVLLLVPLGLVLTFVQLGRKGIVGTWAATEGRPAARAGVVLVTSAAAAFAAYLWIPSSVYRPIQPGERGTLVGAVNQFQAIPSERPSLTKQREQQLGGAPLKSTKKGKATPAQTSTVQTTTQPAATTSTPTLTTSTTTPASTTPAATTPASTTPASTTPASTTATDTVMTDTTATTTVP